MSTVAETLRELESLKHDRAIWMDVVEFLSKCVDHEVKPADNVIKAADCMTTIVPQSTIQSVIDRINEEEIDPLNERIHALENLGVEQEENDEEKSTRDKTAKKASTGKKVGKAGKQARSTKKRIRAVPRPPKQKSEHAG